MLKPPLPVPAPRPSPRLCRHTLGVLACLWASLYSVAPQSTDALAVSPEDLGPLGNYASLADMQQALLHRQAAGEDVSRAMAAVQTVLDRLQLARAALQAGNAAVAADLARDARRLAQQAYWMSYPSLSPELRGVWARPEAAPDWDTAMRILRDHNLNAVFPYLASAGAAWYASDLLPRVSEADRLQEVAQAGLRHGVPVHARLLALMTLQAPAAHKADLAAQGRLMLSASGKAAGWLCPTSSANRSLIIRVATEIVTRAPVAGLQLDYIRYPGLDHCFCPRCQKLFGEYIGQRVQNMPRAVKTGKLREQFLEWRRGQITSLVQQIRAAVRAVRPDLAFSAAVFINWETHRDTFAQDWKAWVDQGLVDFVCPMDYTPDNARFTEYITRQTRWVAGKVPLCPGIGVNADNMKFGGPQQLLDQVTIVRNLGCSGWVIFNLNDKLIRDYLPFLALGATSTPAALPLQITYVPPGPPQ